MSNRIAQVCSSLETRKFRDPNGLRLVETSGPPSGTSTTVVYTYEFRESAADIAKPDVSDSASIYSKLRQMEGILKGVYRELGGAERAVREEREGYSR